MNKFEECISTYMEFQGSYIRWLALPEFSSFLTSAYPCIKFECKCGTELFLTLVNNSYTLSQKVLGLYPQIHQSRLMGDTPAACLCGRMQTACKDVPTFFSSSSLPGPKSSVSGKSQKLHLKLSPLPGLFRVSLVIVCFCFAVHVAASFLQLGAFCFPRIYPLWSVPVSGSFFYVGDLQVNFTWVRNMFLMSYCWYLQHLEILWSILEGCSYHSKWCFQQVLLSFSLFSSLK